MRIELFLLLLVLVLVLANVALEFIARWRNPAIGQFLDVEGVRLHWTVADDVDAMPLVMLHGNGTLLQDFNISGLTAAAANKFRVIPTIPPAWVARAGVRGALFSGAYLGLMAAVITLFFVVLVGIPTLRSRHHRAVWQAA